MSIQCSILIQMQRTAVLCTVTSLLHQYSGIRPTSKNFLFFVVFIIVSGKDIYVFYQNINMKHNSILQTLQYFYSIKLFLDI